MHQLAGFGVAQGAQGHLPHGRPTCRQGVAAGEKQSAPLGRREQPHQVPARIPIEERFATGAEILLKVVEHQKQRLLGQQPLQQPKAQLVVEILPQQGVGQGPTPLSTGLHQRQAHLQADRPRIKSAAMAGDHPAILRQPPHHPARHTALPHPTDAAKQHAAWTPGIPKSPQAGANLPTSTHQITNRQLGHRSGQLAHRRITQGLLVKPEVGQGPLLSRAVESGGGSLRQIGGQGGPLVQPSPPLRLQLLTRQRQGAAGQHRFNAAEMAVKGPGQLGGVAVAHRGLHCHHSGDAGLDQGLSQTGADAGLHAPMAGVQHHQRQRAAERADRRYQLSRRDGHRLAVLVFQLQAARSAMAAEMQHVIGISFDGRGDLIGMAHLQDLHLHVVASLSWLHRVQDVLHFPLVIQHGGGPSPLVRGADRHQHFEGARQRRGRGRGWSRQPSPHQHGGLDRQQPAIGKPHGLERQPQQLRVFRLDLHQHRRSHLSAIQQPCQNLLRPLWQAEGSQRLA